MTEKVDIWQATEAFTTGDGQTISLGDTVAAGHPVLKGREIFFRPFAPTWDFKRDKAAAQARNEEAAAAEEAAKEEVLAPAPDPEREVLTTESTPGSGA